MSQSQSTAEPSGAASASQPLLALKGFSKSFGPVEALKDVDFEVYPGEVVALVGDNGAGKSTLIKAISGAQPPDTGSATWEGRPVRLHTPHDATELGHRDRLPGPGAGREPRRGRQPVPRPGDRRTRSPAFPCSTRRRWSRSRSSCSSSLGVTTLRSVRTEVGMLSGGQRQAVAIARSLLGEPKLVMLDEPTAALGIVQTAQILKLIERLRERGLGVIVISHNLADVFEVADRIAVLRLGRMAATFTAEDANRERGRRLDHRRRRQRARDGGDAAVRLRDRRAGDDRHGSRGGGRAASRSGGRWRRSPAATSPRSGSSSGSRSSGRSSSSPTTAS